MNPRARRWLESQEKETPEQIWHKEVGAPESRIIQPFEGFALAPQTFPTSNLVLGPVLHCSGICSLPTNLLKTTLFQKGHPNPHPPPCLPSVCQSVPKDLAMASAPSLKTAAIILTRKQELPAPLLLEPRVHQRAKVDTHRDVRYAIRPQCAPACSHSEDGNCRSKPKERTVENGQRDLGSSRVLSIDALRGFTMFWIIGGAAVFRALARVWPNPVTEAISQQLTHLNWGGFRFYDLIFPMFLFIVGVVLPFSVSRRLADGQSRTHLYLHTTKRAALLILLGLIRDDGLLAFDWPEMRGWGVLSLIGVGYFVAAVIVLNTRAKAQALITAGLLLGYWAALALVGIEIPDHHNTLPSALSMYFAFTCAGAANALIGVLAGHWLQSGQSGFWKSAGLAIAGLASLITGYAWGVLFPVIRVLWTSSFVLVACGYSLLLLAAFYWMIEVKRYKKWAFFFVVIGMNPITIYMLQEIVDFNEITRFFLVGIVQRAAMFGPLIIAGGILVVKWLLLWSLYRHRRFLKV